MWYYSYAERLGTLLFNECRSLFFCPSFLVSTLSSVVVWLFRQAAFCL
nr:MAG TPA: hypothetical protein [Caudoviricetes sp.]